MSKDPNCIFCKIAGGRIPCAKVCEDDLTLGFLDIGPLAEGHVLLIPKDHCVTADEMSPELAAAIGRRLPELVRAVRAATGCEGVNILQNNGQVAHQFVPHVHFHVIPRRPGDEFHFNWPARTYPKGRMDELAEKIRREL